MIGVGLHCVRLQCKLCVYTEMQKLFTENLDMGDIDVCCPMIVDRLH